MDKEDLRILDGELFHRHQNEWVDGWTKVEIPKGDPRMRFKGGKMDTDLWFKILNFFLWTNEKYKSESQVRLYYNKTTEEWSAYPYPQSPSGMVTNDTTNDEIRSKYPEPWVYLGTAHHHCNTKAFQSGTDEENEREQDGWHYTIGNCDQGYIDYHGRFSWAGDLFKANLLDYVQMPNWIDHIPNQIKWTTAMDYLLCSTIAKSKEYQFDEEWKDSIKPKKVATTNNSYPWWRSGYNQSGYEYNSKNYTPQEEEELKEEEIEVSQQLIDILNSAKLQFEDLEEILDYENPSYNYGPTYSSLIEDNKNSLLAELASRNMTMVELKELIHITQTTI